MFLIPGRCPVCYTQWGQGECCPACGCRATIHFEDELPPQSRLNTAKVQGVIDAARARLAQNPNDGLARYALSLSYIHLHLMAEGLVELQKTIELLPEKVDIRYEWSALAVKAGLDDSSVLTQLNGTLTRKPDFKEALYLRGLLHEKKGQIELAIRNWQVAYQIDPTYAPASKRLVEFITVERSNLATTKLNGTSLDPTGQAYLKILATPSPPIPQPLGKTSLEMVRMLSADTAGRMEQLHVDKVRQYETACKKRETALKKLETDVIGLSNLCLASLKCRQERQIQAQATAPRPLSIQERSAVLDRTIQNFQKSGFRLISKTDTTAQLHRPKQFSCCLAFFLVIIVIGIILYLVYYLTKRDDMVYLEVDEFGRVKTTYS